MLNKLVKDSLQPKLKAHGFRKKALSWNRSRGEFIDVVTVQEAGHSTAEEIVFTVNIGLFVPEFFRIIWGKECNAFATEADCLIRLRLGDLIQGKLYGDSKDQWWTLSNENDFSTVSERIEDSLECEALPFLVSVDSYESAFEHVNQIGGWQSKDVQWNIQKALLEWKNGRSDKAVKALDEITAKAWQPRVVAAKNAIQ